MAKTVRKTFFYTKSGDVCEIKILTTRRKALGREIDVRITCAGAISTCQSFCCHVRCSKALMVTTFKHAALFAPVNFTMHLLPTDRFSGPRQAVGRVGVFAAGSRTVQTHWSVVLNNLRFTLTLSIGQVRSRVTEVSSRSRKETIAEQLLGYGRPRRSASQKTNGRQKQSRI